MPLEAMDCFLNSAPAARSNGEQFRKLRTHTEALQVPTERLQGYAQNRVSTIGGFQAEASA
ncbi:hypothetical protein DO97_07180 [Neosynechococcus sphagnicola sy1]|uniref:Uncharacterized protein n=1 Tax=Neosynechococcus sphagnicola sy1 TaxID=1497020 RepID=A0A098TJW5_9CYAN|nr:hypothetical protein DO97_07180 [Neosynechococcus sphagnicola sy1]